MNKQETLSSREQELLSSIEVEHPNGLMVCLKRKHHNLSVIGITDDTLKSLAQDFLEKAELPKTLEAALIARCKAAVEGGAA